MRDFDLFVRSLPPSLPPSLARFFLLFPPHLCIMALSSSATVVFFGDGAIGRRERARARNDARMFLDEEREISHNIVAAFSSVE